MEVYRKLVPRFLLFRGFRGGVFEEFVAPYLTANIGGYHAGSTAGWCEGRTRVRFMTCYFCLE